MKALIFENKVVDVQATEFEVAPTMTWVDCDDTVKIMMEVHLHLTNQLLKKLQQNKLKTKLKQI